jgi:putative aminopeptidase FrvX
MGTALDPRAGVHTLIEIMRSLSKSPVEADVYVSFNAQEEATIGRHAALCTRIVNPHIVLELCNSLTADIPGVREDLVISKQGEGVCVVVHEQTPEEPFAGYIVHPRLFELFIKVAKKRNIKYQIQPSSVYVLSGVPFMRLVSGGIPSIALNMALGNGHTPYETLNIEDIFSRKYLIQAVLPYLTSGFIEKQLPLE